MTDNKRLASAYLQLVLATERDSLWPADIKALEAALRVLNG